MPLTGAGNRNTRDIQILDQRDDNLAATSAGTETTRIEQTRGTYKTSSKGVFLLLLGEN